MSVSIGLIAQTIEKIAPKSWAEEWDNVGLLVGHDAMRVERVLLTLDATQDVIEEAKEQKAQLIIAHHPILFKPLKNLRADNQAAQIPIQLVKEGIAFYAAHTNLDQSKVASAWTLGNALGLAKMEVLAPHALEDRGYGVIGSLPTAEPLETIVEKVAMGLDSISPVQNSLLTSENANRESHSYRVAGKPQQTIRKVAILNGSGGSFIPKALFKGADLLITGDVDHHSAWDAQEAGMAIMDIGHFGGEVPMVLTLAEYLQAQKPLAQLEIVISARMRSPWTSFEKLKN